MRAERWRLILCSLFFVPIILIAAFFAVVLDHGAHGVYAQQGWSAEEQAIAEETFRFLSFRDADMSAYTEREISHLADVRLRLLILIVIFLILLVALLIAAAKEKAVLQDVLFYGGLGTLCLVLLLGLLSLLDFSWFWTRFHELLFPGGNWAFPADSTLITLFPQEFFNSMARNIILAASSYALAATAIGYVWKGLRAS